MIGRINKGFSCEPAAEISMAWSLHCISQQYFRLGGGMLVGAIQG
jgi:hypothetical protein